MGDGARAGLGGGGSILAVPIFVYALGFGAKEAIAASLAVVGLTSLLGAAEHWREGHVRLRVAFVFGSIAAVGAYLGAHLAGFLERVAPALALRRGDAGRGLLHVPQR